MPEKLLKLNIQNEFGTLKTVVVCWGDNIPVYEDYKNDDPEFTKYHPYSWDKNLFLKQQESFFNLLEKYKVKLIFPKTSPHLVWQAYTRDTAFVIGDKLYYSNIRKFQSRKGEVENLLNALDFPADQVIPIEHEIEGGDVLVINNESVYVGDGSRTSTEAIEKLSTYVKTKTFELGENVMHLDTRLTILPNNIALVNTFAFNKDDLEFLQKTYQIIEVFDEETKKLGTNVFVINPETIVVPTQHLRIAHELESKGFIVETIDYTEPINLGGSFRCTTLPLKRD